MKFVMDAPEVAAHAMYQQLREQLAVNTKVLWLVSGGSNIPLQTRAMELLSEDEAVTHKLSNLTILLMDERYGDKGHAHSNHFQMLEAGFSPVDGHLIDVLAKNLSFSQSVEHYQSIFEDLLSEVDYIFGSFGIGADRHTAGVLPNSPATEDTEVYVVGFTASDFERLTLSPIALVKCDSAILTCYGPTKNDALSDLKANQKDIQQMPSKLLYSIKDVTVYNDFIED